MVETNYRNSSNSNKRRRISGQSGDFRSGDPSRHCESSRRGLDRRSGDGHSVDARRADFNVGHPSRHSASSSQGLDRRSGNGHSGDDRRLDSRYRDRPTHSESSRRGSDRQSGDGHSGYARADFNGGHPSRHSESSRRGLDRRSGDGHSVDARRADFNGGHLSRHSASSRRGLDRRSGDGHSVDARRADFRGGQSSRASKRPCPQPADRSFKSSRGATNSQNSVDELTKRICQEFKGSFENGLRLLRDKEGKWPEFNNIAIARIVSLLSKQTNKAILTSFLNSFDWGSDQFFYEKNFQTRHIANIVNVVSKAGEALCNSVFTDRFIAQIQGKLPEFNAQDLAMIANGISKAGEGVSNSVFTGPFIEQIHEKLLQFNAQDLAMIVNGVSKAGEGVCKSVFTVPFIAQIRVKVADFEPRHLSMIVNGISKAGEVVSNSVFTGPFIEQIDEKLLQFNAQELAMIVNGVSKAGEDVCRRVFTDLFIAQIQGKLPEFNAQDLAMIANGVSKAGEGVSNSVFTGPFIEQIHEKLLQFNAQGLAMIVNGISKAGEFVCRRVYTDPFIEQIQGKLPEFNAQELAMIVNGVSKAGEGVCRRVYTDPFIAQIQGKLADFEPQHLAMIVNGISKAGEVVSNSVFTGPFIEQIDEKLLQFNAQELAMIVNGVSKAGEDVCRRVFTDLFIAQIQGKLPEFNAQDLAMIANGVSKAGEGVSNSVFTGPFIEQIHEKLLQFNAQGLAMIVNGISKAGEFVCRRVYTDPFIEQIQGKLPEFNAQDLAMIVNGISKAGEDVCRRVFTDLFIAQIQGKLPEFNAQDLAMISYGLIKSSALNFELQKKMDACLWGPILTILKDNQESISTPTISMLSHWLASCSLPEETKRSLRNELNLKLSSVEFKDEPSLFVVRLFFDTIKQLKDSVQTLQRALTNDFDHINVLFRQASSFHQYSFLNLLVNRGVEIPKSFLELFTIESQLWSLIYASVQVSFLGVIPNVAKLVHKLKVLNPDSLSLENPNFYNLLEICVHKGNEPLFELLMRFINPSEQDHVVVRFYGENDGMDSYLESLYSGVIKSKIKDCVVEPDEESGTKQPVVETRVSLQPASVPKMPLKPKAERYDLMCCDSVESRAALGKSLDFTYMDYEDSDDLKRQNELYQLREFESKVGISELACLPGVNGAFSTMSVESGELLGEYLSEEMMQENCEDDYVWSFYKGNRIVRSVSALTKGNWTRFMNHSEHSPNVEAVEEEVLGQRVVRFYSIGEIKKGDQLCFPYGPKYYKNKDYIPRSITPKDGFEIVDKSRLKRILKSGSMFQLLRGSELLKLPFIYKDKLDYSFPYLLKNIMVKDVGVRLEELNQLFDLLDSQTVHQSSVDRYYSLGHYILLYVRYKYIDETVAIDLLNKLVEKGYDLNCQDKYGSTLLHDASSFGLKDVVTYLLSSVNLSIRTLNRETAFHVAIKHNQFEIAKLLVEKRKNFFKECDKEGRGWVEMLTLSSLDKPSQQASIKPFQTLIDVMKDTFTVYQCSRVIPQELDDEDLALPDPFKTLIRSLLEKRR